MMLLSKSDGLFDEIQKIVQVLEGMKLLQYLL